MTLVGTGHRKRELSRPPETKGEADVRKIREKAKENELTYPIAVDNELANWKAWGNRWWPSTYLIDKQGY